MKKVPPATDPLSAPVGVFSSTDNPVGIGQFIFVGNVCSLPALEQGIKPDGIDVTALES